MTTKEGGTIQIPELSHAPQLTDNLLSAAEITTANNYYIVLGPHGGCISKAVIIPHNSRVSRIQKIDSQYVVPLCPSTAGKHPFNARKTIYQYFNKGKPRPQSISITQSRPLQPTPMTIRVQEAQSRRPTVRNPRTDAITHTMGFSAHLPNTPTHHHKPEHIWIPSTRGTSG